MNKKTRINLNFIRATPVVPLRCFGGNSKRFYGQLNNLLYPIDHAAAIALFPTPLCAFLFFTLEIYSHLSPWPASIPIKFFVSSKFTAILHRPFESKIRDRRFTFISLIRNCELSRQTPMRNDSERNRSPVRPATVQYDTCCQGRATAIYIDKVSRFFFPFSFLILNVVYWSTFL